MRKALLATERDIAQGKLRFLFTAPGAIVGNSRWSFLSYQIVAVTVYTNVSAYSFRIIVRYFTAYYTENKR